MASIPGFVLLNRNAAYNFALAGYRVITIMDDSSIEFKDVPNIIDASILMPPYEAASFEFDGRFDEAAWMYEQWLNEKECMDYINLIGLGLMKGFCIALYFGEESNEMRYPAVFCNFIQKILGISFSLDGANYGSIRDEYISINLGRFLLLGLIDIPTFYMMMPEGMDLTPDTIMYLDNVLKPIIDKDAPLEVYNNYFKKLISSSHRQGKYVVSPFRRPE